jgi:acetyl-CoA carboxylase biotin carboxyl carrier protein
VIEVRAEMAANVWQVHVEPGQAVEEGETLAILESMKMEIPVESPGSGIVAQILIAPEGQVDEGDLMIVIEGG